MALLGGLPAVAVSMAILWWVGDYSDKVRWTFTLLIAGFWVGCALAIRERVASPLRTLANLLEAMREGDYSIRAHNPQNEDALGEVMQQVNAIGSTLRAQRLGALEATTLLRKVMEEIDVAVFTFDNLQRLKLVNRAGERLLGQPSERILDLDAATLGLSDILNGSETTVNRSFPGGAGRWGISRTAFREEGLPLRLLVLTDVTRALREEELRAWQRIVRVLGHELNNSLTPIKSIAGSLGQLLRREPLPEDWRSDTTRGLDIISARSDSLGRFIGAYARLAKLPAPQKAPVRLSPLLGHVAGLETRMAVILHPGPDVAVDGDSDQLEQLFINLIRNAVEAGGPVEVGWIARNGRVEVSVVDGGPGVANPANLFVPFFTTKPGGSGIGLVLSRQIAEAHEGTLTLVNRQPGPGCEARLVLPVLKISEVPAGEAVN
jgi:two-component system, NtrC family, nitrogen regulation sensor histidine kinase NtrY